MKGKLQLTLLILGCCIIEIYADLPASIQKCKSVDNDECIAKAFSKILELYPEGNDEFGLTNIAALKADKIVLSESKGDTPIQLNLEFNNVTVYGLEKLKPLRVHGFDKNLTSTLEIDVEIPEIKVDGDYILNGKLLLLPLNGKGKGSIIFNVATLKFKIKSELEKRNNKNYGVIKKFKIWYLEPEKITFKFQNLANGNTVLSESLNQVINENWKDLWNEFRSYAIKAVTNIVVNVMNDILNVLPVDDFYVD